MSFSGQSFGRLIKYRIADSFRPLAAPVDFPKNAKSWLDGMIVTHIDFNRVDNDRFVVVNEVRDASGAIGPNTAGYGFNASAVAMEVAADISFARVEDVAAAGLTQPPTHTEHVFAGVIHILVRASVDKDGIPQLQMELDIARLSALGLPAAVIAGIAAAGNASFPFDIGKELKDIFPPVNSRVLNAGITRDDAGSIVLRFEFPGEVWQSAIAHANDWQTFFSSNFLANLGNDDWCMDLDGGAVASGLAKMVNPLLKDEKPIDFNSGIKSGFIDDTPPRAVLTKHGLIVNACAGNDVNFDAFINVDFTVPADNLIRGKLSFDFTTNGWDVAKCVGLTLVNPLSIFITAVDNHELGIGLAELAISFVFPTKPVLMLFAMGLMFAGVDQMVAQGIVADRLKDNPSVTKLPNGGFAFDRPLAPKSGLTKDWLALQKCSGSDGRMLLSGALRVPDAVLPRLTASDLEGFSKWILVDRCEPGKGQSTSGSLALALTPGYGADMASVQPVKIPTIPLKWGVRPEDGGDLVYQVLNDRLGIFQDKYSEYREVYVPGIPGVAEVTLKESTVRKRDFQSFAVLPYPLRLRFFTNGGVREYEFKAPPPLQDFIETPAQAFERINNCKHRGSSLVLKNYLELKWRVDPPTEGPIMAQQWDVHVRGLEPGRKATVWNQDTGVALVQAFADETSRVDVSLVLRSNELAGSLLMGLDDRPFLPVRDARRLSITSAADAPPAAVEVAMRQTMLTEIDQLEFDEPIQTLHLAELGTLSALVVRTVGGLQFARCIPSPYSAGLAGPIVDSGVQVAQEDETRRGLVTWRGKDRQFTLLSQRPGRTDVLAEYWARSSYDLAAQRDDFFAQVSSNGRRVTLFLRGVPVQFGTHEWEDASDSLAYPQKGGAQWQL
jgi:hypothetical protein